MRIHALLVARWGARARRTQACAQPCAKEAKEADVCVLLSQEEVSPVSAVGAEEVLERLEHLERLERLEQPECLEQPAKRVKRGMQSVEEQTVFIWREMTKKEVPKVFKLVQQNYVTRASNSRKTAVLCSKEARRWQFRTHKSIKDMQARAKRAMREMLIFWKRNEREEREQRKRAEKEALERAKRAEEQREAMRQARKLNFLITQTELYSHFISRKISNNEGSLSTENTSLVVDRNASEPTETVEKPSSSDVSKRPLSIKEVDFDGVDDESLREIALRNAQEAIALARDRAEQFNVIQTNGELKNERDSPKNIFDGSEMNFMNPSSLGNITIKQPKMLQCQLKEYQLKGLNWLVNLYEQGINGILADEMGLGKTVQSISVMAYLAENHNIWGPFFVIAPASTLHNWQQEITRFVPKLKVLPYWGNGKDRKILRKFWNRKQLTYTEDAPFHVLVTSYQLVVQDAQYFQRIKWQYMILDEAQAIKSSNSSRWKNLLDMKCRNRLLLTGTPIQNTMQELWALLHFIMPSLFDSHDEFSEWFSKDIESHAQSNTSLNEQQLQRLHMILKPFMLRRVKKHVQSELGEKIELEIYCNLSYRQKAYYKTLREKISIADIIEKAAQGGDENVASLMNIVMQFRKVCNHPYLFERTDVTSPLCFAQWVETPSLIREGPNLYIPYSLKSLIKFKIPKLLYRDGGILNISGPNSSFGFRTKYLNNVMNIFNTKYIYDSLWKDYHDSPFLWLYFTGLSPFELARLFHYNIWKRALHNQANPNKNYLEKMRILYQENIQISNRLMFLIRKFNEYTPSLNITNECAMYNLCNVPRDVIIRQLLHRLEPMYDQEVSSPPVDAECIDRTFTVEQEMFFFDENTRKEFLGLTIFDEKNILDNNINLDFVEFPIESTLGKPLLEKCGFGKLRMPAMSRFVTDSGKLAKLDELLATLKAGGHRVLIYFQMTKMIDLMEEYLTYRQYKYLRLDGSSKINDRRDMVNDWQTRPEIFVFLLSTRAGGLGINLTAADTVIFYDSDWNPSSDAQATDRAHRIGQMKQVTVYRFVTRGTIEERILERAKQKQQVQNIVISGGKSVEFGKNHREVVSWLLNDNELEKIQERQKYTDYREEKYRPYDEDALLCLGLSNSEILLFSISLNEVFAKLVGGHTQAVTGFVFSEDFKIGWSCGMDGKIVEWDILTSKILNIFSFESSNSLTTIVHCQSKIICASHSIYVLRLPLSDIFQTFSAHIALISSLLVYSDSSTSYIFSASKDDRFINVFLLNEEKGENVGVLVSEDNVKTMTFSKISDKIILAVLTKSGSVNIFYDIFNKPLKNAFEQKKTLTRQPDSKIVALNENNLIQADIVNVNIRDNNIIIAIVNGVTSIFETVSYLDDQGNIKKGEIQVLLKDSSFSQIRVNGVSKSGSMLYNEANAVILSGDDMRNLDDEKETSHSIMDIHSEKESVDIHDERTLSEKLEALEMKSLQLPETSVEIPSASSLVSVLSQALQLNDKILLESCLNCQDSETVLATIKRLESPLAVVLLERIAERLSKRPSRVGSLNIWIRWTIIVHGGYLITLPNLMKTLSSLQLMLSRRASALPRLLALHGRLDMINAQIKLRECNLENEEPGSEIEYIEDEDEDSDEEMLAIEDATHVKTSEEDSADDEIEESDYETLDEHDLEESDISTDEPSSEEISEDESEGDNELNVSKSSSESNDELVIKEYEKKSKKRK
ncbi:hypothetical protein PORY_002332 [Pneumocystis oryctolagi]|uniref:Uncharacterized protein n=1 Tax=Pneumocystis oryctolagi TaxID=42067 RepID=A0ACB7CBC0_9ASCO|nr:hypothetical protein PORY_002332 [Pneumocystis oryctolagi]